MTVDTALTADRRVIAPAARTRSASGAAAFDAAIVRTREEFDAVAADWLALEARAPGAVVFQSSGWARAVYDFEARRGNRAFDPVIAILRRNGVLVGVLPLERLKSRTRTVLAPLGEAYAQYADILAAPELDPRGALKALLAVATRTGRCDAVRFLKVRADSALFAALPENVLRIGEAEAAPFADLTGFADFDAYLQTIRTKTRKNIRSSRNRLEREAPLTHVVAGNETEAAEILARTMDGRAQRLKDQGLTSRAFSDHDFFDFCNGLPHRRDPGFGVLALSLRHGGTPISEQWGFVHNRRFYLYVTTRDFTATEESPGKLHMQNLVETLFDKGFATGDFMVPAMPYKLTWATGTTPVEDFYLPMTPRGWLMAKVWDGTLRPLAKRIVLALPPDLRGRILKLAGRG